MINIDINLDLWLKSFEANPDPNALYTTQINSTQELLDRCKAVSALKDDKNSGE